MYGTVLIAAGREGNCRAVGKCCGNLMERTPGWLPLSACGAPIHTWKSLRTFSIPDQVEPAGSIHQVIVS